MPTDEGAAPDAGPKAFSSDATIPLASGARTVAGAPVAAETAPGTKEGGRLAPGQKVGPYEIVSPLGKGAMGVVVLARHQELGREVALKVLSQSAGSDAESVERFRRESEAAARLKHANIVGMYERGEADGLHYYAMELVRGTTLDAVIRRERVSYIEAARIVAACAHAMDYAHGAGVLHRDLKPSNILVEDSGRPRITDFGLARIDRKATLTSEGIVVGTPLYLSPEVARGERATRQSDIYSLGATLYELATGKPPYKGVDGRTVLLRVLNEPPISPVEADPRTPRDLVRIISRAMARDSAQRYAHARHLAVDLERFVEGRALEIGGTAGAFREAPAARHVRSIGLLVVAAAALLSVCALVAYEHQKRVTAEHEKSKAEKELKERGKVPRDKGTTDLDAVGVRAIEERDARVQTALAQLGDGAQDAQAKELFEERLGRARELVRDGASLSATKFREALQLFPRRWDVRVELARAIASTEPEEAEKELSLVVLAKDASKDARLGARLERARLYRSRGDKLGEWLAATDYNFLIGSQYGDAAVRGSIMADLALVSVSIGDTATARRTLEALPSLAGDDLARASLARAALARIDKNESKVAVELSKARAAVVSDELRKAIEDWK